MVVCFYLFFSLLVFVVCSPNSACARGSGGVECFDCRLPPPAVANFGLPSSLPAFILCFIVFPPARRAGRKIFLKRKLVLRWIYVRGVAATSRTGRQSSHTELALPWSPVVPKILSFGELVWLASVGPQFVCQ